MKLNVSRICPKSVKEKKTMEMRMKVKVETMKINGSRICPKSVTVKKTFQMRMKIKVKTIENQRVFNLSKKRHKSENIPNAVETKTENQRNIPDFTFIQNFNSNSIYVFINEVLRFSSTNVTVFRYSKNGNISLDHKIICIA